MSEISIDRRKFFDFIVRKEIPFESIEEEMSDRLIEDEFNSDIAEKALDIAFDIYPEKPGEDESTTIEKRHEFVSEFMEYCREEVTKKWARNLGMKPSNYISPETHNAIFKEVTKQYEKKLERVPQDSEDEAWEQMKVFQKRNFNENI